MKVTQRCLHKADIGKEGKRKVDFNLQLQSTFSLVKS